jgi:cyclopropane fatty-acyl-phospholipid synthase-like methyltransferase
MFRSYVYVSGTTKTLNEHFRQSATNLVEKFQLPPDSLVVDIGSNDGTFLQHFKNLGMNVVGVDPATNILHRGNGAKNSSRERVSGSNNSCWSVLSYR